MGLVAEWWYRLSAFFFFEIYLSSLLSLRAHEENCAAWEDVDLDVNNAEINLGPYLRCTTNMSWKSALLISAIITWSYDCCLMFCQQHPTCVRINQDWRINVNESRLWCRCAT
jgi:hypothetical protein